MPAAEKIGPVAARPRHFYQILSPHNAGRGTHELAAQAGHLGLGQRLPQDFFSRGALLAGLTLDIMPFS